MREITNPPARVARADVDLQALASKINAAHEAGERKQAEAVAQYRAAGEALSKAKALVAHGQWLAWLKQNVRFDQRTAQRYMEFAKCDVTSDLLPDEWRRISGNVAPAADEDGTAPPATALPMAPSARPKGYVTLDQWEQMTPAQRRATLAASNDGKTFNDQGSNESIEWALWSWNPVTGCRHSCPYCYARNVANHLYEQGFEPSIWPARLHAPGNEPFPEKKIAQETDPVRKMGLVRPQA
jgi:hypothetical protein